MDLSFPSPDPYIDTRNRSLWETMSNSHIISLDYHEEPNYKILQRNDLVTIFLPRVQPSPEGFTHELLHLWLIQAGKEAGTLINESLKADHVIVKILKRGLIEHIANCVDHFWMLPEFVRLGYDREKFIEDYHTSKNSEFKINRIENWLYEEEDISRVEAVSLFVDIFFAMKSCPNPEFDYSSSFLRLKKIDEKFYRTLDEFWDASKQYDGSSKRKDFQLELIAFTRSLNMYILNKIQGK